MTTGDTIIASVGDNEQFTDKVLISNPRQFNVYPLLDGNDYEYNFKDWLIGSDQELYSMDMRHVIVWYFVENDIHDYYMEYLNPTNECEAMSAGTLAAEEYLKSQNNVH